MLTSWLALTLSAVVCVSAACTHKVQSTHTADHTQTQRDPIRTLSVVQTVRVKGQTDQQLTLDCGEGQSTGLVQLWHTPFGDLQFPTLQNESQLHTRVFIHLNGSLIIPETTERHNGLYYCVLQHTQSTTLWPIERHVNQKAPEHKSGGGAFRARRDVGSKNEIEKMEGVSEGVYIGAMVGSVLLTFVLGFSAGAVSRARVLRCLGSVTRKLRSPHQQQEGRSQSVVPDSSDDITMKTVTSSFYINNTLEMTEEDSANCVSMETTVSSTASWPPAKPKRSFKQKQLEQEKLDVDTLQSNKDHTAYLEGCDYGTVERRTEGNKETFDFENEEKVSKKIVKNERKLDMINLENTDKGRVDEAEGIGGFSQLGERDESVAETDEGEETERMLDKVEDKSMDGEVKITSLGENTKETCVDEAEDKRSGFYRLGETKESKTKTDENKDGGQNECTQEKAVEEDKSSVCEEEDVSGFYGDGQKDTNKDEEMKKDEGQNEWKQEDLEETGEQENEKNNEDEDEENDSSESDEDSDSEDETTQKNVEHTQAQTKTRCVFRGKLNSKTENPSSCSTPQPRRRSRVIRLYQYDEDGQRYAHLPKENASEISPTPSTGEVSHAPFRPKQRSLSLTRLNKIMAAATSGPMDSQTGKTNFHMAI